jgi:hypothetical protein
MNDAKDKIKHQPEGQNPPAWTRSQKLTAWLLVLGAIQILMCIVIYSDMVFVQHFNNRAADGLVVFLGIALAAQVINLLLILALWRMHLWAFGVLALTAQLNCLTFASVNLVAIGSTVTFFVVLFGFVRPEIQRLKDELRIW